MQIKDSMGDKNQALYMQGSKKAEIPKGWIIGLRGG